MPDSSIVDAGKTIIDAAGFAGAILILTLAAAAWVVRQWMKTVRELYDEKDARLRDSKEFGTLAESLRNAMAANTAAIQTMLGHIK